jgi:predicted nucleotidyltransferase
MPSSSLLLSKLREQRAPESHLIRLAKLVELAEIDTRILAIFLVGSYARGIGDRVSDLDLVAIAAHGESDSALRAAHNVLSDAEVLNQFTGRHSAGGAFWKLVYLDFSSVEFHVFEPGTKFKLKRPYLSVWDPNNLVEAYVVDGQPVRHEDFAAYEYGDEGLIWELVDCIKWLSRGRNKLARHHLKKLVAEMERTSPTPEPRSAAFQETRAK